MLSVEEQGMNGRWVVVSLGSRRTAFLKRQEPPEQGRES